MCLLILIASLLSCQLVVLFPNKILCSLLQSSGEADDALATAIKSLTEEMKRPPLQELQEPCTLFCNSIALQMQQLQPHLRLEFQQAMLTKMYELTMRNSQNAGYCPQTPSSHTTLVPTHTPSTSFFRTFTDYWSHCTHSILRFHTCTFQNLLDHCFRSQCHFAHFI